MGERVQKLHSDLLSRQIWGATHALQWCSKLKCSAMIAHKNVRNGKYAIAAKYFALAATLCQRICDIELLDEYATTTIRQLHDASEMEIDALEKQAKDRYNSAATHVIQTWKISDEEKEVERILGDDTFHMEDVKNSLPSC